MEVLGHVLNSAARSRTQYLGYKLDAESLCSVEGVVNNLTGSDTLGSATIELVLISVYWIGAILAHKVLIPIISQQ